MRRTLLAVALVVVAVVTATLPAEAHPMGNFSINHYASLTVDRHTVRLLYVVDMAEIPTFQELSGLGVEEGISLSPGLRARYLARKARELQNGLTIRMNGRRLPLRLRAADLIFPPGAGNLSTERVYLVLDASLPSDRGVLTYADANFSGRSGWKEIVVTGGSGARIDSSMPATSSSHALTVYPTTTTSPPPQDLGASLSVSPGPAQRAVQSPSPIALIRGAEAPLRGPHGGWSSLAQQLKRQGKPSFGSSRSDPLSDLMKGRRLSLGVLVLSLVVAFWFGAGHALSPGHGKTIVGAYLVGSRGTAWHALILGLTVTATHSAGVFALGFVTLYLSRFILPDQLYPWLGFTSGLTVALMGVTSFVRRWHALRATKPATVSPYRAAAHPAPPRHAHSSGAFHVHRHGPFGRAHSHAPVSRADGEGVRARDLLALGISGGILPCPSALVVLLSAIAFHRIGFGLLLIVAFSLGLAGTLTSVGLLMVYGGRLITRARGRSGSSLLPRALRAAPVFSALAVAGLGSLIALGALSPGLLPAFLTSL